MAQELKGHDCGQGVRVGIISSRFNEFIAARLVRGAMEGLTSHGVLEENITVVWVPGSFELPAMARRMSQAEQWDALLCLGVVIRGETAHFEHVASQAASGIALVAREASIPVIFGVLTTYTVEQAMERSGGTNSNRGHDTALSALEMVNVIRGLDRISRQGP